MKHQKWFTETSSSPPRGWRRLWSWHTLTMQSGFRGLLPTSVPGLLYRLWVEYCCRSESFRKHLLVFPLILPIPATGCPSLTSSLSCLSSPALALLTPVHLHLSPAPPSAVSLPYPVQDGASLIRFPGCTQRSTSESPLNGLGFSVMAKLRAAYPKHSPASQRWILKELLSSHLCVPRSPDKRLGHITPYT